ncbi:cold-shock protein, partial [Modestobacter sp. VKM Ac-2676]
GARRDPETLVPIIEDLIKLLDRHLLRPARGRYPDEQVARKVAIVLRAVADDLDA